MLETVQEYNRCGQFVRVFPCRNSKQYEKYFSGVYGTRMINRLTWKILFSSEVLPYERGRHLDDTDARASEKAKKDLKYDVDGLPAEQSYDQFRSKVAKQWGANQRAVKDGGLSPTNASERGLASSGSAAAGAGRNMAAKRRASKEGMAETQSERKTSDKDDSLRPSSNAGGRKLGQLGGAAAEPDSAATLKGAGLDSGKADDRAMSTGAASKLAGEQPSTRTASNPPSS